MGSATEGFNLKQGFMRIGLDASVTGLTGFAPWVDHSFGPLGPIG